MIEKLLINMKYIYYKGPDVIVSDSHHIREWRGKAGLKSNTVYELEYPWNGYSLFGYNTFYIFDELENIRGVRESRGYEISVSDVLSLRDYNLEELVKK